MTTYSFETLKLHRVWATPFARNLASIRVLEKLGYRHEGTLVESAIKAGRLLKCRTSVRAMVPPT